jgi:predicted nucleotidyltransferase
MELRPGLGIDCGVLHRFAARHGIRRPALYGSALRGDLGPDSDIDILVEFWPGRTPGSLRLAGMERKLEAERGREVELRTYEDLSHRFRGRVASSARPLSAA